jgi:ATP synthase protein I
MKSYHPPHSVKRLLQLQIGMVGAIALIVLITVDVFNAYSAFLGGLVCVLPNSLFAYIAFRHRGAHAAKQIVADLYWGEAIKLVSTAILFALVLATASVAHFAFIATFVLTLFSFWLAPWIV